MKGLSVNVLRDADGHDCTNGGISSKVASFILTGCGLPELFESDENQPALKLVARNIWPNEKPYYTAYPVDGLQPGKYWTFGGNFVYTCDSRLSDICHYPIPIHDRQEG